ncbi:MAG: hypothetical protein KDB32_13150, partial [Planctomycetes bacterium]|nr:hypothetical protein [Planctomycetota bacterium]
MNHDFPAAAFFRLRDLDFFTVLVLVVFFLVADCAFVGSFFDRLLAARLRFALRLVLKYLFRKWPV